MPADFHLRAIGGEFAPSSSLDDEGFRPVGKTLIVRRSRENGSRGQPWFPGLKLACASFVPTFETQNFRHDETPTVLLKSHIARSPLPATFCPRTVIKGILLFTSQCFQRSLKHPSPLKGLPSIPFLITSPFLPCGKSAGKRCG